MDHADWLDAQGTEIAHAVRDELLALRKEVHNLNWALGTPGYAEMATPEEQAEHVAAVGRVDDLLARMAENKRTHDAAMKDAERYRTMLANLETLVLRTEKGSTLTLNAAKRGEEFTRRGTDATLDGLGAA
jgi:hypothetical protein